MEHFGAPCSTARNPFSVQLWCGDAPARGCSSAVKGPWVLLRGHLAAELPPRQEQAALQALELLLFDIGAEGIVITAQSDERALIRATGTFPAPSWMLGMEQGAGEVSVAPRGHGCCG